MAGSYVRKTIAFEGDKAAGTEGYLGGFATFYPPPFCAINDQGDVAYCNWLTTQGGASTGKTGIWVCDAGGVESSLIVLSGGDPMLSKSHLLGVMWPTYFPDGSVAFYARGDNCQEGVVTAKDGEFTVQVVTGTVPPGFPPVDGPVFARPIRPPQWGGFAFGYAFAFPVAAGNAVAFQSEMRALNIPDPSEIGMWAGTVDTLELIYQATKPSKHLPEDLAIHGFSNGLAGSLSGNVILSAAFSDEGYDSGILCGSPKQLALLARHGQPAPGTSDRFRWLGTQNAFIDDQGLSVFVGDTDAPKVGLWAGTPEALELVAYQGDQFPVGSTTYVFEYFNAPFILDDGRIVFHAIVSILGETGTLAGYWTYSGGRLELLVIGGQEAPGSGGQVFVEDLEAELTADPGGQMAFVAKLSSGCYGLYVKDCKRPASPPRLVVLTGRPVSVRGKDRTPLFIMMPNGFRQGITSQGELVFGLNFTDGTTGTFAAKWVE